MKALFLPFAPSLAHVSRCLAVAEAWRSRGHTAIFAIGEERQELVQQKGNIPVVPIAREPDGTGRVFRIGYTGILTGRADNRNKGFWGRKIHSSANTSWNR